METEELRVVLDAGLELNDGDKGYLLTMGSVSESSHGDGELAGSPSTTTVRVSRNEDQEAVIEVDHEEIATQLFGYRIVVAPLSNPSEPRSTAQAPKCICRIHDPKQLTAKLRIILAIRDKPVLWKGTIYRIGYYVDPPELFNTLMKKNYLFFDSYPYFYSPEPNPVQQDFTIIITTNTNPKPDLKGPGFVEAGKKLWSDVKDQFYYLTGLQKFKSLEGGPKEGTFLLRHHQNNAEWINASSLSEEDLKSSADFDTFTIEANIECVYEVTVFLGKSTVNVRKSIGNIVAAEGQSSSWQLVAGDFMGKIPQKRILDKKIITADELDTMSAQISQLSGSKLFSYQFIKVTQASTCVLLNFESLPDYSRTPVLSQALEEYMAKRLLKKMPIISKPRKAGIVK